MFDDSYTYFDTEYELRRNYSWNECIFYSKCYQVKGVPDSGPIIVLRPLVGPRPGQKHLGQHACYAKVPGGPRSINEGLGGERLPVVGNANGPAVGTGAELRTATECRIVIFTCVEDVGQEDIIAFRYLIMKLALQQRDP